VSDENWKQHDHSAHLSCVKSRRYTSIANPQTQEVRERGRGNDVRERVSFLWSGVRPRTVRRDQGGRAQTRTRTQTRTVHILTMSDRNMPLTDSWALHYSERSSARSRSQTFEEQVGRPATPCLPLSPPPPSPCFTPPHSHRRAVRRVACTAVTIEQCVCW
jgi:hypothetical protein